MTGFVLLCCLYEKVQNMRDIVDGILDAER